MNQARAWAAAMGATVLVATVAQAQVDPHPIGGELHFEEFQGTSGEPTHYGFRTRQLLGSITEEGVRVVLGRGQPGSAGGEPPGVALRWPEPVAPPALSGQGLLPGRTHYLVGPDPAAWRRNVKHFSQVRQTGLFRGVEVRHVFTRDQPELQFFARPHGDVQAIAWRIEGADDVVLEETGGLRCSVGESALRLDAPVAYQVVAGVRREVDVAFRLDGTRVTLDVGAYDANLELVIDPRWTTLLGGSADEAANAVAAPGSPGGVVFVAGRTTTPQMPGSPTPTSLVPAAFVSKLDKNGSQLDFTTVIAGAGAGGYYAMMSANGVAIDQAQNIYVAGVSIGRSFTGSGVPGLQQQNPDADPFSFSAGNGFVVKLTPDGQNMVYATLIGGSQQDAVTGIAVTPAGEAVVSGYTHSDDFAVEAAFDAQRTGSILAGGDPLPTPDGFIAKLDASGTALVYSSLFGGEDPDELNAVALDASGSAYAVGSATHFLAWSAARSNAYRIAEGTLEAWFRIPVVLKVDAAGTLQYATAIDGGSGYGSAWGVDINASGEAVVVGETTKLPAPDAYDITCGEGMSCSYSNYCGSNYLTRNNHSNMTSKVCRDAFLLKLAANGQSLVFSTYLGGDYDEVATGVTLGDGDRPYVVGFTTSVDFPTQGFQIDTERGAGGGWSGWDDAFLTAFSVDGESVWFSTYIGGWTTDGAAAIVARGNAVVLAGGTRSYDFPTHAFTSSFPPLDTTQEQSDAFVAEYQQTPPSTGGSSSSGGGYHHHYSGQTFQEAHPELAWLKNVICLTVDCGRHEDPPLPHGIHGPGNDGKAMTMHTLLGPLGALLHAAESKADGTRSAARLAALVKTLPTGPVFSTAARGELQKQLEAFAAGEAAESGMLPIVLGLNAARMQENPELGRTAGKSIGERSRAFGELVKVHFAAGAAPPRSLRLAVEPASRWAAGEVEPLWPMVELAFDVPEEVEHGRVELQIDLRAAAFDTPLVNPRLLEWTGKDFVDVTRAYHRRTGMLVGDTAHLRRYVVVNGATPPAPAPAPSPDATTDDAKPKPPAEQACPEAKPCPEPPGSSTPWLLAGLAVVGWLLVLGGIVRRRRER